MRRGYTMRNEAQQYIPTCEAISSLVERLGTQRAAAKFLGVAPAIVNDILRGRVSHLSRERENEIRASLALPALPPQVMIDACPDCGSVHHGRCHGRQVALKPIRPRREPQYWRDYTPARLAAAIKQRQEYTAP